MRKTRAAARLFTEEPSIIPPHPAGHTGHGQIADYWKRATATQSELTLFFGVPISEGRRTVVEWWATLRDPEWKPDAQNDWVTLPGTLILRLNQDGLCDELWEYYNPVFGEKIDAPPGWGSKS